MKEEELLAEAKKRYLKGTKYAPAHLYPNKTIVCIVGNPDNFYLVGRDIHESNGNKEKNGHSYSEIIYRGVEKKWAEIISKPTSSVPEYVECIIPLTGAMKEGEILKCKEEHGAFSWHYNENDFHESLYKSWDFTSDPWNSDRIREHFKPSTKEAFDKQNIPKEIELIEGKWYAYKYNGNSTSYAFKYKGQGVHKTSIAVYKYIGEFKEEGAYKASASDNFTSTDQIKYMSPADMEEVYKHFPEEKPKEKTMDKFEAGKTYFITYSNDYEYVIKMKTSKDIEYYISIKSGSFERGTGNPSSCITSREATEDEIQWLEVCNKAKTFISKEEAISKPTKKEEFCLKVGEEYVYGDSKNIWVVDTISEDKVYFREKKSGSKVDYSKSEFPGLLAPYRFHKVVPNKWNLKVGNYYQLDARRGDGMRYFQYLSDREDTSGVVVTYYRWTGKSDGKGEFETQKLIIGDNEKITETTEKEAKGIAEAPKEANFEKGKWYKATSDGDNYYIKFSLLERVDRYNRLHGETITGNTYTFSNFWSNTDFEKQALNRGPLTDLSEIQQYLPDGHVDKISKSMKKSKKIENFAYPDVIHIENQAQYKRVKKYKNLTDYSIEYKYYLTGSHGAAANTDYYPSSTYNIYEFSEVVFPEEYKYEVVHCRTQEQWDFVLSKSNPLNLGITHFDNYPREICLVIGGTEGTGTYGGISYFKSNNSLIYSFEEWCTKFGHVFKSTENSIFKVGDTVIGTSSSTYGITCEGWIGKVINILNKDEITVEGKEPSGKTSTFIVNPKYFALYTPVINDYSGSMEAKISFKEGDEVECISDYAIVKKGDRGKIVKIYTTNSAPSIGVEWSKRIGGHSCDGACKEGYGYYLLREKLKLISSKEEKLPVNNGIWPVGTKVKINPNSDYAYQGLGKEGEIVRNNHDKDFNYYVNWNDGSSNSYRKQDLINIEENVELLTLTKNPLIDEKVNKVTSVKDQLIRPKELILF